MIYSGNKHPPPWSSYTFGLLLLCQYAAHLAGGLNITHLDLGGTITRVAYKDSTDVFVGGVNFVAQLSPSLALQLNVTIGPVKEPQHCAPNPAPCDNNVTTLEIDTSKNILLVCGSAYQGTCTVHSLSWIFDWQCLNEESGSKGASVVSGSPQWPSVTHLLPPTIVTPQVLPGEDTDANNLDNSCRDSEFGGGFGGLSDSTARSQSSKFQSEFGQRNRGNRARVRKRSNRGEELSVNKRETTENTGYFVTDELETDRPSKRSQSDEVTFISNLMVAGSLYSPRFADNPPHLSLRNITFVGPHYTIGYARDPDSKLVGFDVANRSSGSSMPEYKLSFAWEDYSYFLFLQQSPNCTSGGPCITTKISRTCHGPSSALPYVELNLVCEASRSGHKYHLLSSAVLGTVGLVLNSTYAIVPVLVMAFGNGSDPLSRTPDPKYGSSICVVTLDNLNHAEFDYIKSNCDDGGSYARHAAWVTGKQLQCRKETNKGKCDSKKTNQFVQGTGLSEMPFLEHIPGASVVSVLTHTHTVLKDWKQTPIERMDVFLLTNAGKVKKFSLRARLLKERFSVNVDPPIAEFFDLKENVSTNSVAVTDHSRAVIYMTSGQKIMEIHLEFCQQFQTCTTCVKNYMNCRWCPKENNCREKELAKSICQTETGDKCPPQLYDFSPTSVPTQGGSTLTLIGTHLGDHQEEGNVSVTVCDEPCDNVRASNNNVTCEVRKQCPRCATKCNITISVTGQRYSDGNASSFHMRGQPTLDYMIPNVTSFRPQYGPISGGTIITFQGQNIKAGSSTMVKVGDGRCDIIHDSKDLICRVAEDSKRKPGSVNIQITIDNYNVTLSKEKFQFRLDPRITAINPKATIASGGVTLTVDGQNLNSVESPTLKLAVPYTRSNSTLVSVFTVRCSVIKGGNKMKCQTPDISPPFVGTKSISVNASFDMDGKDPLSQLPGSHVITAHGDPTFIDSEETVIKLTETTIRVQGERIPFWIDRSDITVTIGNITLVIIDVTSKHIECDVTEAIQEYAVEESDNENPNGENNATSPSLNRTGATDTIQSYYNTTWVTPRNTNTTSVIITSKTISTPAKTPNKGSSDTSPSLRALTITISKRKSREVDKKPRELLHSQNENSSDSETYTNTSLTNKTAESINSDYHDGSQLVTSRGSREHFPAANSLKDKANKYKISIKIGNYQKELGFAVFGNNVNARPTTKVNTAGPEHPELPLITGASAVGVVFLILVVVSSVMYIRAKKARALVKEQAFYMSSLSGSQHGSKEGALPSLKQILQSVIEPEKRADMDKLIITLDRLTVGKIIGSGNFGCVFEGFVTMDKETPANKVAIKTLQDPSSHNIDLHGFVQEAVIMKDFQHPHVLGLIGLAEKEPGIPYVILPYMDNGDLLTFVRDQSVSLSLHDVIKFGADIASGMAYLSTLKFVHRDLAARNCMLDDLYRVKVADFGLCRDIYEKGYYTSDNRKKLPIRWMAMESIEQGAYSSKSDVWSLGVVLWELLSRGVTPYPGVNGWDIINFLRQRRLAPPYFCPDELYHLMMQCWVKDPNLRPDFTTMQTELLGMIGQSPTITDTFRRRRGDKIQQPNNVSVQDKSPAEDTIDSSKNKRKSKASISDNNLEKGLNTEQKTTSQDKTKTHIELQVNLDSSIKKDNTYTNLQHRTNTVINNVLIVIPTCYSHRDVSKTAAGVYIQLVDNYEPPPKFSNPLLRSMKKHSRKFKESNTKAHKKTDEFKTSSNGYSFPGEFPDLSSSTGDLDKDFHDGQCRISEGSIHNRESKEKSYYELETTSLRASAASESHSNWSTLNNTRSSASILEVQSRDSSASNDHTSGSSLTVPNNHSLQQPSTNAAVVTKSAIVTKKPSAAPRKLPRK